MVSPDASHLPADAAQRYSSHATETYANVTGIGNADDIVERSINQWLAERLRSLLPASGKILDAGCGSGRLLPNVRGAHRRIIGVDASRSMLETIPTSQGDRLILSSSADFSTLEAMLRIRREIFIEAQLEDVLPRMEGLCDEAVSSFNAVCFPHPQIPVNAIWQALRTDGRLYFTSNTFVPESFPVPKSEGTGIDLLRSQERNGQETRMFRHVLHTRGGDVPLQDHVHTIPMLQETFHPDRWTVDEASIFPADGCEHLAPESSLHGIAFSEHDDCQLLHPKQGLQYVKVGIIARKRIA